MKDIQSRLSKRLPQLEAAALQEGAEKKRRLERVHEDFPYFCNHYLKQYFACEAAAYQKILYKVAQNRCLSEENYQALLPYIPEEYRSTLKPMEDISGIADIEPRGHGKSTRWTFAFPLWLALTGRSKYIVITSADKDSAVMQMSSIKFELENNDNIIEDFGLQRLPGNDWKADNILLSNKARIQAFGKGGSMRGAKNFASRPDYVIVDDAFKDNESESEKIRDKVYSWFSKTVLPIGQTDTLFIMVNTITHNEDLPSRTLQEIADGSKPDWIGLRFSAEVAPGQPLWPERYSWEYLKNMEKKIGSLAYAQEYLSRALSDEDRIFRKEWFRIVQMADLPADLKYGEGIDPATGVHDESAVVDAASSKWEGKIYVIASHGQRESTDAFKKRLIERYKTFRYKRACMETVTFQEVYKNEILRDAMRQGISLPIKGILPGRASKAQRMMGLSPLIENGTIVFLPGNEKLIKQLCDFPTGGYDDLCDALYYAVKALKIKGIDADEGLILGGEKTMRLREYRRTLNI